MAILGCFIFVGAVSWQKFRLFKAQADKAELEATLIQSGDETWVKEKLTHILPNGRKTSSVEYARLGGIRLRVNGHDHLPTESEILYATTQQSTGQTKLLTNGTLGPLIPPTPIELLPLLDKAERVLIKGASDAGKTELLKNIASRSKGVIILDPHFTPGVWPVSSQQVIGAGRNYKAIEKFLDRLMIELDERYRQRALGVTQFKPLTVIIDEFQSVREECKNAGKDLSTLIRESRKVGFRLFIGSHSELVKALGLEGQGDIRDGLLIVRLSIDQVNKRRICKIDDGSGEKEAYFPLFGQPSKIPDLVLQPTDDEAKIVSLAREGKSYNEIARQVLGGIGGYQNRQIKEVLKKWGV